MIVLDTNHFSELRYQNSPRAGILRARLATVTDQRIVISAVTVEEHLRGWLAELNREKEALKQIPAYARLVEAVRHLAAFDMEPFDAGAAVVFDQIRKGLHIGTLDLKIAATALKHDALLLSENLRHFSKVPNLRVENWMLERKQS